MIKKLRCWRYSTFVLWFLLISGSSATVAFAQATATPEPEPLFKTSTPHPTDFYDCVDGGEMGGYGTETPSVSWMNNCSPCLDLQDDYHATATPMPTLEGTPGTPAPTATPAITPTPGFTPGIQDFYMDVGIYTESGTILFPTGYTLTSGYGTFQFLAEGVQQRLLGGECTNYGSQYINLKVDMLINGQWYQKWKYDGSVSGVFTNLSTLTQIGTAGQTGLVRGSWRMDNMDGVCDSVTFVSLLGNDVMIVSEPEIPPEPTPTQSASLCGNIEPAGSGGFDAFDQTGAFTIPVPLLGTAQCNTLLPEFSIPSAVVNIIPGVELENDLVFPGLTFCVRTITMGTLSILNMSINLDFYAVLIGGMMILRKLLRS